MSNPFKLIRRYQKQMMVVFGVVLMASFGLGTVLSTVGNRAGDGRGGRVATTLVKWRGGSLTDAEIDRFRERHFQTQAFLAEVLRRGADENMTLKVPYQLLPILSEDQSREFADRSTVELIMLAQKAKQDGFVVGDIAVDQYLTLLGNNRVDAAEYPIILKRISDHFSVQQLKDHLKLELAALNYEVALRAGLGGARAIDMLERQRQGSIMLNAAIDPLEAWEAFDQLNRKASCEVIEIDVKEFVDEIGDEPAKNEIKKLYEDGKGDFPDPTHRKPGFKIPNQAKIGVFEIDRNAIVRREQGKISDEEVQRVYDEWVANKDKRVIDSTAAEDESHQPPLKPPAENTEEKPEGKDTDAKDTDAKDTDKKEKTDESDAKQGEPKASDSEKKEDGGEQSSESEKSSDGQPKQEKSDSEKSTDLESKADDAKADPSKDESEKTEPACDFDLNSSSQDESAEPGDEKNVTVVSQESGDEKSAEKSDESPAETSSPNTEEKKSADEESGTDEKQGDEKQGDEKQGDEKTPDNSTEAKQEPDDGKTEQPSTTPPEGVAQPAVKIKPLDENLAQQIRSSLVNFEKVEEMVEAAQAACAEVIDNYYYEYDAWKTAQANGERVDEPVLPDFDAVAKANRVSYEETAELMSLEEFLDHPLGQEMLFYVEPGPDGQPNFRQPPLAQFAFAQYERRSLFQRFDGRGSKNYLIWFIEKVDAHTPKLDVCRPQVIKYWQYQQGLDAAKKEAERMAKEAEDKKQTLTEAFVGKAKPTGQFTWMSSNRFDRNAAPDISPVSGVSDAGDEFMKTVFSLDDIGNIGVAANARQDKVYVIQLKEIDQQENVLQEQFFRTPALGSQASLVSILKVERMVQEIKEQIMDEMDVQWVDAVKK